MNNMRTPEEVQAEIDWREKEIKELKSKIHSDYVEEEYKKWRIQNLTIAIEWCKWFLKQ